MLNFDENGVNCSVVNSNIGSIMCDERQPTLVYDKPFWAVLGFGDEVLQVCSVLF